MVPAAADSGRRHPLSAEMVQAYVRNSVFVQFPVMMPSSFRSTKHAGMYLYDFVDAVWLALVYHATKTEIVITKEKTGQFWRARPLTSKPCRL